MKSMLHLAIKDLRLISRDWLGLFFIVVFPIGMGIFFGLVSMGMSSGPNDLPLAVVDEDDSEYSQRLITLLEQDSGVSIEKVEKSRAMDEVRRGDRAALLVIPEGFGDTAGILWSNDPPTLQMGADPSRAAESGMLEGYVMKAMGQLVMDRFQDPDSMQSSLEQSKEQIRNSETLSETEKLLLLTMMTSIDNATSAFPMAGTEADDEEERGMPSFQLAKIEQIQFGGTSPGATGSSDDSPASQTQAGESEPETDSEPSLASMIRSPWDISFPSAMMWGVLGCVAGFAVSIVREKAHGTFTRLQIAPISRSQLLLGKATACFIAVVAVVTAMSLLGYALGMRPKNLPMLLIATLCIAYCFVGLMMSMSVIGKSEEAVAGGSWGINVIAAMFGGGMVPLAFMPSFMRTLSNLSPVKWAVLSLEGAIWRQFSWGEELLPLAILLAIGTAGFALGCYVLSRE